MSEEPQVAFSVFAPAEISPEDRAAFEQMVLEAGEVDPQTLPGLIDRALALAFARLNGALVGVGAIKRPYSGHRGHVFSWAKSKLDPKQFEFELGWVYVKPAAQNRRIASRLVDQLMPALNGAQVY